MRIGLMNIPDSMVMRCLPRELELTTRERHRLQYLMMKPDALRPDERRRTRRAMIGVFAIVVISYVVPFPFVSVIGLLGTIIAGSIICTIASTLMAQRMTRTIYLPAIARALRTMGHDVCGTCGYWLANLPRSIEACPECGARRESLPTPRPEQES